MSHNYLSSLLTVMLFLLFLQQTKSQVIVVKEQIDKGWNFTTVMPPSRNDAALNSKITIVGNKPIASCLSPDGLHNGVIPQENRLLRDFFLLYK